MRNGVVVGFDPGTARLGYGVIVDEDQPRVIDFGVLDTSFSDPMAQRLKQLYERIGEILQSYHPEVCAIEQLFFSRNVTTALSVGQARGIVMLAAGSGRYRRERIHSSRSKTGSLRIRKVGKAQMQEMVRLILALDEVPYPDHAADALAVALCHAQTARFRKATGE